MISLIIVNYNQEHFLGKAIASVLAQTRRDWELLIWDDGSTDNSVAIAREYEQQDDRVRVIAATHQGVAKARKNAVAETRGNYIGWIDSDDWIADTALEETAKVLDRNPAIGMVYTDYYDVNSRGKVLGIGKRCNIPYSPQRLLVDFMTFHFRLIRREVYEQIGGINCNCEYAYDYNLCLRLSEVSKIERIQKPLYYYRHHGNNISYRKRKEQIKSSQQAVDRALQRRGLADTYVLKVEGDRFYLRKKPASLIPWTLPTLLTSLSLMGAIAVSPATAQQIIPNNDGTMTVITKDGNSFNIDGGTLSGDGKNLFHSFQEFGLDAGQIANFLSNPNIQNILGRINGGNPSLINGLIQVTGGNSNLFLMNPSGIIFGNNASLNVPGDFTATTATGIGFGDGWFNAVGTNDYLNLVGNPDSFNFTNAESGVIINAGDLQVADDSNISLTGGTVINTGTIETEGGNITVAAIPGTNRVRISQEGQLLSLEVPIPQNANGEALPIRVVDLPNLLRGLPVDIDTGLEVAANDDITVANSNTVITHEPGTIIVSGTVDAINTQPGSVGGEAHLLGGKVGLIGANIDVSGTNGGGEVLIGGDYKGQGTVPNASRTFVSRDSVINADALKNGDGGRVIVWADEVTGFYGNINASGGLNSGDGGFVEVSGKESLSFDGTVDVSANNGDWGTLLLDPTNISIANSPSTGGVEASLPDIFQNEFAGTDITINAGTLQTQAGDIILEATNNITISGGTSLNFVPGGTIEFKADADGDTNGSFVMFSGPTVGPSSLNTNGRSLTITAADIVLTPETRSSFPPFNVLVSPALIEAGTGNITFQPSTPTATIGIGENAAGDFNLDTTDLTENLNSSGTVTIGSSALAETVTINSLDLSGENYNLTVRGGPIVANGSIQTNGNDLTLNAGNAVDINQNITTNGGAIDVSSGGNIDSTGTTLNSSSTGTGGAISLEADNDINTGLILTSITGTGKANVSMTSNNGSININDRDETFNNSVLGRSITINAPGKLSVAGGFNARSDGAEDAGDITIGNTLVPNSITVGTLSTRNLGGGGGGNINITTTGSLNVTGAFSRDEDGLPVSPPVDGNRNDIASIASEANANGGVINISADGGITTAAGIFSNGQASGGNINLTSSNGTIETFTLDSSSTNGNGGTIELTALNNITTNNILTTNNNVSVNGSFTLANDVSISIGGSGGNISFIRTVDGNQNLILDAGSGDITFTGAVGSTQELGEVTLNSTGTTQVNNIFTAASLTTNAEGRTDLNGSLVTTTGNQIYNDPVILTENITLNGSNVTFNSTVDAETAGGQSLTVNASGTTTFGNEPSDRVGGTNPLEFLTTDAPGTTVINTDQINTTSDQTFNDNLETSANIELNASNGDITTQDITTSGNDLDINANSISTGNITTQGGEVELESTEGAIATRDINSSGTTGGDVTLNSVGNISVESIKADGTNRGGNIKVNVDNDNPPLFVADSIIEGLDGNFSIFTGGTSGGEVTIKHGGAQTDPRTPFQVGFGEQQNVNNGTAGAIGSRETQITDGSFIFTERRRDIAIISNDPPNGEIATVIDPPKEPPRDPVEPGSGSKFTDQPPLKIASIPDAQQKLREIEQQAAQKPALVYISFTSPEIKAGTSNPDEHFIRAENCLTAEYQEALGLTETQVEPIICLAAQPSDKLEILVVTPEEEPIFVDNVTFEDEDGQTHDVTREKVETEAQELYRQITGIQKDDWEIPGEKLYEWLIGSIEEQLEAREIDNLLFVLPPKLRSLPLAALYDWEQDRVLVEKGYNIGLAPSINLMNTTYNKDVQQASVLALGASKFKEDQNQQDLNAVEVELPQIVNLRGGQEPILNEQFTLESLQNNLDRNSVPIVHLSTHANFDTKNIDDIYIQLYNRKLTLSELRSLDLQVGNSDLELLVLSACRSAFGNTDAELGFAGLAVKVGVKTAVGSLWKVSDLTTPALMIEFYNKLKTSPFKAEALRLAQVAMRNKDITIDLENRQMITSWGEVIELPENVVADSLKSYIGVININKTNLENRQMISIRGENIELPENVVAELLDSNIGTIKIDTINLENRQMVTSQGQVIELPENVVAKLLKSAEKTIDLSHPYYWAPFTVIGSPW